MKTDSYEINLGNFDNDIRNKAESNTITFWAEQARKISWFKEWEQTLDWKPPFAKWFVGGKINASFNTLDVHQNDKSSKTAIFWEGEDGSSRIISYSVLFTEVKKFSNVLKSLGVKSGDRVTIYLPMVPELIISMLACARIGAIHIVVFSGFSAISLKGRVEDSQSKVIITADGGYRKGKIINLKEIVDENATIVDSVEHVIVLERIKNKITINKKDKFWTDLMTNVSDVCSPEELDLSLIHI